MKNNNLPEFWAVQNDGSQLFKEKVVSFLNKIYSTDWVGEQMYFFYGYFPYIGCSWTLYGHAEKGVKNLTLSEFISLTEEKEEWMPKAGEFILVSHDKNIWVEKRFLRMGSECFVANSLGYFAENFKYAKPTEQPKEAPFTPTIGKVCYMYDAAGEGVNMVFVSKFGDKFIGAGINEYDDLIKGYIGQVEIFNHVGPAEKLTKEVTFSEVAQKFETTVDKLKIKGYVNEQDAIEDVIKEMKSFTIPADKLKAGDKIEFSYSMPFKMDPGIKSIFTIIST